MEPRRSDRHSRRIAPSARRAGANAAHSEALFLAAFEQAPVGLCLLSPAGRFVKANAALCKMLGYSETELLSLTVRDLTHPDDLTVTDEWARQLLAGETAAASEQRYLHKAGHVVWGMVRASPLSDTGGSERFFITHIQDITERKRTEEEHKALLERIGQHVGVAIEAADLYRAQEGEAAVSGALARVGQELMSAVDRVALLDRLCRLTTEVLGCDHSHTFLWQSQLQAFVAVAGYGDSPEQWEMIRLAKLDRPLLAAQLDEMERKGIFSAKISDLTGSEATPGACARATSPGLMVPLRRGNELVGFHTAGYRGRQEVFDTRQEHIARGLAQLGSLALENARLIEELDEANRLKSDFVGTISHEFRTPLSIIIGYTDLMLEGAFGDLKPEQVDTVQRVQKRSMEMVELVNATLDLSRLEAGRIPLDITDVGLADLFREVDGETRHLQEKSALNFLLKIPPDLQVRTDRTKLKLVIKNLIGNAIKFTQEGSVMIEACPRGDGIEIAVSDTGIGIAPDALPTIFEPFRRADGHVTKQYDGVGLGLYIVRRFLQALGGSISVESKVGCGSTFRVWLPVSGNVE